MRALIEDYQRAELSARERAICTYAVKLTKDPQRMSADDVADLRVVGLDDAEILDTCQVTAYYNFVNRMADGLGVELEAYWDRIEYP